MTTIDAVLAANCRKFSAKTALRHKTPAGWQDLSYHNLWCQVEAVAAGLLRWGVLPGDRIALLAPSSPRWVCSYLGALRSGGIAVPIDKELKKNELRHILSDSGARVLFTEDGYLETLCEITEDLPLLEKVILLQDPSRPGGRLAQTVEELNAEWQRIVSKYRLPVEENVRLNELSAALLRLYGEHQRGEEQRGVLTLDDERRTVLEKLGLDHFRTFAVSGESPPPLRKAEDTAVILYTSGTTGRSKGAMLSHANLLSNIQSAALRFRVDSTIHTLSFLPINHVYEQVCGILLPLYAGGTISFAESIKKLGQNLKEVQPNFLLGVPAVFRLLLDRIMKNIESKALSRRLFAYQLTRPIVTAQIAKSFGKNVTFISGGAALDPDIAQGLRDLGFAVYQGYGITETSPVIAFECPGESRLGSVGRPMPGIKVRIENHGEKGVGEILVQGPNVMQGYYNNPQATKEVLEDGWYRTGDLGYMDADGYLYLCGRKKNLIVTSNGKNVYPEEVENELLKSPFIAEAMVYGHKVAPAEEEVYALLYPDQEALDAHAAERGIAPLGISEVEEIIRLEVLEAGRRLADYKRVRKFTLREDEFPKTTTRKIKRFAVEADICADRG